jgi:riboflavin synthase
MFTGIVTAVGTVRRLDRAGDLRAEIGCDRAMDDVAIGASIACDGVCLTVADKGPDWFGVDISAETLSKTTLGAWVEGTRINLERSLRLGDELGGHIVSGHVDGVAEVQDMADAGASTVVTFRAPEGLARYIAAKGSVALNGTSLTVNTVDGAAFSVNMIPHTKAVTTWGGIRTGDRVNIEVDMLARYVARLAEQP